MAGNDSVPVFDGEEKKWTVEGPGGVRIPGLFFPSKEAAQKWCDTANANWER